MKIRSALESVGDRARRIGARVRGAKPVETSADKRVKIVACVASGAVLTSSMAPLVPETAQAMPPTDLSRNVLTLSPECVRSLDSFELTRSDGKTLRVLLDTSGGAVKQAVGNASSKAAIDPQEESALCGAEVTLLPVIDAQTRMLAAETATLAAPGPHQDRKQIEASIEERRTFLVEARSTVAKARVALRRDDHADVRVSPELHKKRIDELSARIADDRAEPAAWMKDVEELYRLGASLAAAAAGSKTLPQEEEQERLDIGASLSPADVYVVRHSATAIGGDDPKLYLDASAQLAEAPQLSTQYQALAEQATGIASAETTALAGAASPTFAKDHPGDKKLSDEGKKALGSITAIVEAGLGGGRSFAEVSSAAEAEYEKSTEFKALHADELRAGELLEVVPWLSGQRAQEIAPHLNAAMKEAGMTSQRERAAFVAQLAEESMGFTQFEELADGWEYEGRIDLGNTHPGDGPRFKGRGPIQITGRANYREAGQALGLDLENHPELASHVDVGFRVAAWYWRTRDVGSPARSGDFEEVTRRINGALNGYADRLVYYERAEQAIS